MHLQALKLLSSADLPLLLICCEFLPPPSFPPFPSQYWGLNTPPGLFYFIFPVVFCLGPTSDLDPLYTYGLLPTWDHRLQAFTTSPSILRWGLSNNFLPRLTLNLNLSDLHLSSSWDYRYEPLCPASLVTFSVSHSNNCNGFLTCLPASSLTSST
jgi:hypothetical protein